MANGAASPCGNRFGRRVIVKPGIHQELLVYEHDDRNFDGWTETELRHRDLVAQKDQGAGIGDWGLLGWIEQGALLCLPWLPRHFTSRWTKGSAGLLVTERFPSESKKGMSRGGINFSEISDLGERHTDRIPTLDVTGLLTQM
jgi:hypothetical protein